MVMMRGNNVKTLALILVVVGLVAIEQTQQVQASHCCCHLDSVPTYFDCRAKSDSTVSECCGVSAGYISDDAGFECKSGYIDIETALQVAGGTDDAMERCTGGCHDLCTRNNAEVATVRDA
uniref:Uncharacterized protein n=1 Tax=Aegilops tauschii TaxID=37682 RepID=M8C9Y3_AEGTA